MSKKHLEDIDGYGTAVNREEHLYHDYMTPWRTPFRPFLWLSSAALLVYGSWKAYSVWKKMKQTKHKPIGIQDRPWEKE